MKKVITTCSWAIMIALCLVSFSSCSSDDKPDNSVVGKWSYHSFNADIAHHDPLKVAEEKALFNEIIAMLPYVTINVKADKTFALDALTMNISNGTWEQNGNNVVFTPNDEDLGLGFDIGIEGTGTVQNGILTFTADILDEIYDDASGGETYRDLGFTKYTITMQFKK